MEETRNRRNEAEAFFTAILDTSPLRFFVSSSLDKQGQTWVRYLNPRSNWGF